MNLGEIIKWADEGFGTTVAYGGSQQFYVLTR